VDREAPALTKKTDNPNDARPGEPVSRQAQKSEATVAALLLATQDLLLEIGYARLTTAAVAERAGVSRGALTHHFRSKEHLITTAIDSHLRAVIEGLAAFAETIDPETADTDTIVEYLWQMMSNGLFQLTMEYLPEARVNEDFREEITPVVKRFHAELERIWAIVAQRYHLPSDEAPVLINLTMCLIRGMVAQSIVRKDQPYFDRMLIEWKLLLKTHIRNVAQNGGAAG
jgi:AcrR family transcriptional regulator